MLPVIGFLVGQVFVGNLQGAFIKPRCRINPETGFYELSKNDIDAVPLADMYLLVRKNGFRRRCKVTPVEHQPFKKRE